MVAYASMGHQAYTGVELRNARLKEAIRFAEIARTLAQDDAFVQARVGHVLTYLGQKYDLGLFLVDQAVVSTLIVKPGSEGAVSVMCLKLQQAIEALSR